MTLSSDDKQQITQAAEAFAMQLAKCMETFNLPWDTLGDPVEIGAQAAIDVTGDYHYERSKQRRQQRVTSNIDNLLVSSDS